MSVQPAKDKPKPNQSVPHSSLRLEDFLKADDVPTPLLHLPTNLRTSSIKITGNETAKTSSHSFRFSGTMPKTWARKGTYRIKKCSPNDRDMARSSHGFAHGGIVRRLPSSERALRELNISMATKTDRERVIAFILPVPK